MRQYAQVRGLILVALLPWRGAVAQARSNYEELQTFSGVLNHIRVNYVDSVHYGELVRAAIDGVLRSLDPHSRFQSREEVERAAALTWRSPFPRRRGNARGGARRTRTGSGCC